VENWLAADPPGAAEAMTKATTGEATPLDTPRNLPQPWANMMISPSRSLDKPSSRCPVLKLSAMEVKLPSAAAEVAEPEDLQALLVLAVIKKAPSINLTMLEAPVWTERHFLIALAQPANLMSTAASMLRCTLRMSMPRMSMFHMSPMSRMSASLMSTHHTTRLLLPKTINVDDQRIMF
jgi:hypothetical protein